MSIIQGLFFHFLIIFFGMFLFMTLIIGVVSFIEWEYIPYDPHYFRFILVLSAVSSPISYLMWRVKYGS